MEDEYDFSQSIPNPYIKSGQSIAIANASTTEADLLQKITHCIPPNVQTRFNELVKQRQANTIDNTSLQELCDLSDQIELLEADRIQQLAQLAQLRSTSIEDLMQQHHLIPVNLSEDLEDYCLNGAIDVGKQTPLLTHTEALVYQEE